MGKTSIEWTDHAWPVVNGCRRISAGCGKGKAGGCYAERLAATRLKHTDRYRGLAVMTNNGPQWTGETRLIEKELDVPLRRRKPTKFFVCDMGDLFYEGVPFDVIDRVWAVMMLSPQHTFQVLTKRAARMREYVSDPTLYERVLAIAGAMRRERPRLLQVGISNPSTFPPSWIWLGVSAEDQAAADARIPHLLDTPAAIRWVSYEPALGPIDFTAIDVLGQTKTAPHPYDPVVRLNALTGHVRGPDEYHPAKLDWIVVGGESGPGARPFKVAWAKSTIDQCRAAGVPVFVKQLGADVRTRNDDNFTIDDDPPDPAHPGWPIHLVANDRVEHDLSGHVDGYQGAPVRVHLGDRKGGNMAEWRGDLRVRQWPEVRP